VSLTQTAQEVQVAQVTQEQETGKLDPQIPIKLKLYLTQKERQAYRLAANLVGKESIADYLAHAIQTYTVFLLNELQAQAKAKAEEGKVEDSNAAT